MRRTDRLFDLIGILRDGRLHKAADLARRLEVSERTVYRDMETLRGCGIPVEGERGVGYILTAPVTLPPLNLTLTELEALHLGMAVVSEAADPELQAAARSLAAKIDAVVPEDRTAPPSGWGFAVYPFADAQGGFTHMPTLRAAIRARQKLALSYWSLSDAETERTIRPLQMEYWGRVWTLTAWCELREDFRVFRVDRIQSADPLPALFTDEPGKTLDDYMARMTGASDKHRHQ
ncbi:helix-turn-helix transcriptional regulator [Ovoidimarina sediminis]|uniref:helix-turn-helix transcriptional regulator n=1 Tax=Ovoidimarina sediminis TaxID=3079856 RepID=UPI00290F6A68|nr:YafY family protein [Rhodophyticola sp. MJ-SS7]MDU8945905.1 YafY family protein [Rhodophyticola sp. MJ-SS7]